MTVARVLSNARLWHVETTDVLDGLCALPDGCVQCVVTSPPYWGLRDYGAEGQIGLEKTPQQFVDKMVEVFSAVRGKLRDDGTCWLNLGDSWNAYNGGAGPGGWNDARDSQRPALETGYGLRCKSLKPKDLCGIPWRVALALQDDGWWLRQDIIWAKPNGMPESVRDRCTKSHEYIFLLTKSERYFYDGEAIKQPPTPGTLDRLKSGPVQSTGDGHKAAALGRWGGKREYALENAEAGGNRRSVWTIPVGGFREAHFATFPLALPETCLKAGTSLKGCCSVCGAPWQRVTESERVPTRPGDGSKVFGGTPNWAHVTGNRSEVLGDAKKLDSEIVGNRDPERHVTRTVTTGWQPGCDCNGELWPCLTLDPFNGAGTTGLVAAKGLGLRYIGLELNPEYAEMSRRRINKGFVEPTPKIESAAGQQNLFGEPA